MMRLAMAVLFTLVAVTQAQGADSLWLPPLFADGMVLQSGKPVAVWGKAGIGAEIQIVFDDAARTVVADASGRWATSLAPLPSGGPHVLTVSSAGEEITLRDVMVGQVWLCSGQSNMAMQLAQTDGGKAAAAAANDPLLRVVTLARASSDTPQETAPMRTLRGSPWLPAQPDTAGSFSGVAYYFGKKLRETTGEPVGLIVSAYGGTLIQTWTDTDTLAHPDLRVILDEWNVHLQRLPELKADYAAKKQAWEEAATQPAATGGRPPRPPTPPIEVGGRNAPAATYNAMLHPLIPFTLRGVLWYQGESDAAKPQRYATHLPLFIQSIRRHWRDQTLPFYCVQLPNYGAPNTPRSGFATVREAQRHAAALPHTGLVVTIDIGDPTDIHPRNKKDVGERSALWALAHEYNHSIEFSGPLPRAARHVKNTLIIEFDHAKGLCTRDGAAPASLEVADASGVFTPVAARIEGQTLVLDWPGPQQPVKVRYGWGSSPPVNLYNAADLPASPFELAVE